MVSVTLAGLLARAPLLLRPQTVVTSDISSYSFNVIDAVKTLQGWYKNSTGLWDNTESGTGWWNSANCLTALGDWALHDSSGAQSLGIADIMANTFVKAQLNPEQMRKRSIDSDLVTSMNELRIRRRLRRSALKGFDDFLNEYYDDEGWWALAWIRAWDVTHEQMYLDMAETIFADMKNGTTSVCGGGIWWNKTTPERAYKNAIANELYLSVAASLANRIPGRKAYYLYIAQGQWDWFRNSGMINEKNLINDGLTISSNGTCVNNNQNTWSYNQGVILGGLVELSRASGNTSLLTDATTIAKAALALLSDAQGIIHESNGCEPFCGCDGSQFKGIFVRNLNYLHAVAPQDVFHSAIMANADSIWRNNRDGSNRLGINWSGPASAGQGPNASTHSSALDVMVAAMTLDY